MEIEFLPLLGVMRKVYALPRGPRRFQEYLRRATGHTDELLLPILAYNPMAREHVAERLDELLAMGAEEVAAEAAREAARRLRGFPESFKVGLEVPDDVAGGGTNRYLTDAAARFPRPVERKWPFVTALLWASETPDPGRIREAVLAAVYRAVYRPRVGLPQTLEEMLRQEGLAGLFAGSGSTLEGEALARARREMQPYRESDAFPVQFACLYGDEAAVSVGYPPLGFPAGAGFAVALAEAREQSADPVTLLLNR